MYEAGLLKGRVIVVTGGGSGLGKAMALRMAGLGAKVGIVGRTAEKLDEVAGLIRDAGGVAATAVADVRDPVMVDAAFTALEAELGPVDTLVNNAAGNFLAPTEELSPNAFDAVVRIVLHGTFYCTQRFANPIIAEKGRKGVILNILTTYAWMGSPFVTPSAAAKAGVLAMMRGLAVEWAAYGIRTVGIAPGPIHTEGAFSRLVPKGFEEQGKARNPMHRYGEPSELADLAVYLVSDGAGWVNGECVTLDGGEWLQSGQEFGHLTQWDRGALKQLLGAMRPSKRS